MIIDFYRKRNSKVFTKLKKILFVFFLFEISGTFLNIFIISESYAQVGDKTNSIENTYEYLFLFGGFPDVRHLGGGIVSPHSESNPATLELIRKYDINLSFGFSETLPKHSVQIRATDSSTSFIAGGMTFKCLSGKFFCSGESQKILGIDISYPFQISDFFLSAGLLLRTTWGEPILQNKPTFLGVGTLITRSFKDIGIAWGGTFISDTKFNIGGGTGISLFTDYIFGFAQVFYLKKIIFSAGATVKVLTWFRLSGGFTEKPIIGGGFVSPRLYIWAGYSFIKTSLINIGIIF